MIKRMGKASYIMQTEISTRVTGLMIKQMEEVCILTLMEPSTVESGKMTSNMERVLNPGLMELYMKVNTMKERKTGEVS